MKPKHHLKPQFVTIFAVLFVAVLGCSLFGSRAAPPGVPETDDAALAIPSSSRTKILFELGEPVQLADATLGPQGGVFRVENTGTRLDGFQIDAPQGLLSEAVDFSISAQEVLSHNLPPELRINLPMIAVETSTPVTTGEAMPEELFQVSLPLQLPADVFAMFFIFDEAAGSVDGLPVISQDETHLLSVTPGFSKLVIVEADKKVLDGLNIRTGFVHGVHNWQFTNRGSFIAPSGHCAGQSVSAMYYYEMTGGEPLFGVYDATNNLHPATPGFDADDRLGYRLASVAQEKMRWQSIERTTWHHLQNSQGFAYYALTLAMHASGDPQYISVRRQEGGHALIAYEKYADRFYISDPNFPAPSARRAIVFNRQEDKFNPYYSGPSAEQLGVAYPWIYYVNKSWLLSELQMDVLWSQFLNGTIGNDLFPRYTLMDHPPPLGGFHFQPRRISTSHKVDGDTLTFSLLHTGSFPMRVRVYDDAQNQLHVINQFIRQDLPIGPGSTKYMFEIQGWVNNRWRYIDGRWVEFTPDFSGSWNSGPLCDEVYETRYRWQVSLIQDQDGNIRGTVHFHNCPLGGQVYYHVTGSISDIRPLVLSGNRVGGAGDLFENSPVFQNFQITRGQPPMPNFAP